MTEPKDANSGSTSSQPPFNDAETQESAFLAQLLGLLESRGYAKVPPESISEFFRHAEKFASTLGAAAVSITFKRVVSRRFLRLHKNIPIVEIMLFCVPTNNNTHTPVSQPVTS